MKLTGAQRRVLEFAIDRDTEIVPRRGQEALFYRLSRAGLLDTIGWGVDEDDHTREVFCYRVTDSGRRALRGDLE